MSDRELLEFLDAHPDWSPAVFTSEESDSTVRIGVYGAHGPSGHFFNFTELRKTIHA